MPGTDGVEATHAVRTLERAAGKHTPIIALTAHAMRGEAEKLRQAGMDGYVAKPVRTEQLFGVPGDMPACRFRPCTRRESEPRIALLARTGGVRIVSKTPPRDRMGRGNNEGLP